MSAVTSMPCARAALIFATTSGMRPQLALPATLMCQISTGSGPPAQCAELRRLRSGRHHSHCACEWRRCHRISTPPKPGRSTHRSWRRARARTRAKSRRRPLHPHGLPDQFPHLVELCRCRLLVIIAKHHASDLGGADIAGQIDPHALLFEAGKILSEAAPVGRDVIVIVPGAVSLDDRVIQGAIESPSPVISVVMP